jgi:phosphomannomutase
MIMYEFENGVSVTLRTSGTEPKIKFYTEIAGDPTKVPVQSREELEQILHSFVNQLVEEMLQPEENGLKRA